MTLSSKESTCWTRKCLTGKIYWGQYIVVKSGLKPDDFIAFPYAKDAVEGKVCKEADISDLYGY